VSATSNGEAGFPASLAAVIDKTITYAATAIALFALVSMFLALCAEVIFRYVTKSSLGWPSELPNFMFPWLVMSGIVLAAQHGAHISVTLVLGKLARRAQCNLLLAMQVVIVLTFFYLAWIGLDVIEITGSEVYPVTGVSARWAYLALIAGFAGVGVTALTTFVRLLLTEDPLSVRAHHAEEEL
jgi:TRAP-type C4-dicarboxylate transport system permease small subunit